MRTRSTIDSRFFDVLILLRLAQRFFVRALDADEDGHDVGRVHQLDQLFVFGEVERRLGEEREGISLGGLPRGEVAQQLLYRDLVADQVVVDDEGHFQVLLAHRFQLGDHLRARLQPRPTTERDDDVAELALERAAAAELDAAEQVVLGLQQVVARHRHLRHVGRLGLLVAVLMPALGPFFEKLRPGRFRFADEDRISQAIEIIFLHGHPRTADDREDVAGFQFAQNLEHPSALDGHAGEPHDVGPRQTVVVDRLDVLIDDGHGMAGGRQRREQRQADGR